MRSARVIVLRRRTHPKPEPPISTSFQILRLDAITEEDVLLPWLGNIGTIGTQNNKRKLLNQNDRFDRVAGTTVRAGNVAGGIRQELVYVVSLKVLSKLAVAFLERSFS